MPRTGKPIPQPLKIDPTRTGTIRKKFLVELRRRLRRLKREIAKLVQDEDAFGLKQSKTPALNAKYSSTQVNVDDEAVLNVIKRLHSKLVQDPNLVELEKVPHITVRYGLHTQDAEEARKILSNAGVLYARLGRLSLFQTPEHDVLKFHVYSTDLKRLNLELGTLPHTDTFSTYVPHLTVAYLKPGTGHAYVDYTGIEGVELRFKSVMFSDINRQATPIVTANSRWKYLQSQQKLGEFQRWLSSQTKYHILGTTQGEIENNWWEQYIEDGYLKGAASSYDDVNLYKKFLQEDPVLAEKLYSGSKQEFMRSIGKSPVSVEQVKLLASRVFTEIDGVTKEIDRTLTRVLADGLVQNLTVKQITDNLLKEVDTFGEHKAKRLISTEIVRSHADGQLNALKQLGLTHVQLVVEWVISGINTCPKCRQKAGQRFTLEQAAGLIPFHPFCRCGWKAIFK